MATISKTQLQGLFEIRFDYYSARVVLSEVLAAASVGDVEVLSEAQCAAVSSVMDKDPTKFDAINVRLKRMLALSPTASEPGSVPVRAVPVAVPGPAAVPEPAPMAVPEPAPVAVPEPAPVAVPEPAPVAVPEPAPVAVPEPAPVGVPEPAQQPEPLEIEIELEPHLAVVPAGVHIVLRDVPANVDDVILAVGAMEQLGNWDPDSGAMLDFDDATGWTTTLSVAPGTSMDFKFVKISSHGTTSWEGGANRKIVVPESGNITFEGSWQR